MTRNDIKIEAAYITANNDLEWFASDMQHVRDTINSNVGEWKERPMDGVGISNYLNSTGKESEVARKVIIELKKDKYVCHNPTVTYGSDGNLEITPNIIL
jgi:hypothetical protein